MAQPTKKRPAGRSTAASRKKTAARKASAPAKAPASGGRAAGKTTAAGKRPTKKSAAGGTPRAVRANGAGVLQSAGATPRRTVDPAVRSAAWGQMGRLLRETGAIVCFFAALLALLSLATFHIDDPGWSHTGSGVDIANSVGRAGAWFADVTFYLFGFMAYLVPLMLGVAGYLLFRDDRGAQPAYRPFVFVRLIGAVLMLASASGLADLHFAVPDGSLPRGTFGGGILGMAIAWRLVAFLHHLGTTLFLLAAFFCSLTLAFGTSWIALIESLGGAIVRVIEGARGRGERADEARAERERVLAADRGREERRLEQEAAGRPSTLVHRPEPEPDARFEDEPASNARSHAALEEQHVLPRLEVEPPARGPLGRAVSAALAGTAAAMGRAARGTARQPRLSSPDGLRLDDMAASFDEADALLDTTRGSARPAARAAAAAAASRATSDPSIDAASASEAGGEGGRSGPGHAAATRATKTRSTRAVDRPDGAGSADDDAPFEPTARTAPPRIERVQPEPLVVPAPSKPEKSGKAPAQPPASLYVDVPDSDLPPIALLDEPQPQRPGFSDTELEGLSRLLEEKLAEFRITVAVVAVHPGPVITRFEMQLAPGIKASRVTGLAQDIARSMSLVSVRVVEVIPGKSTIGIEVPNEHREMVQLSEMLRSRQYVEKKSPLTLALGKDISGQSVTADLGRMPHLLVAGTTGSGKSVAVNAMLVSLLFKATAKDVRLILIDPKMLELNVYDGIPHLLAPVVTDMKEAANALRWCVGEMERRYMVMAELKVRGITGYNKKINDAAAAGHPIVDPLYRPELALDPSGPPPTLEPMPFIVVVVDEFADMIMQVGKKAEELIARIAQKARAAGIHLILATQRPSVDVITGLIKANVPTRIAFQVSSKIDSRTIIDQGGAESLLGHGDMLYQPPGSALTQRVHGAFVDDHEVVAVVQHIKQTGEPNYIAEILQENTAMIPGLSGGEPGESDDAETDALYDQAVAVVLESRKASISYVQRRLKIGYNRAARMIEQMEESGVISAVGGSGVREVLAPPPQHD